MSVDPLVVYHGQSAVATVIPGYGEESVALAHVGDCGREIDFRRSSQDDLSLSLSAEDEPCSGSCPSASRALY